MITVVTPVSPIPSHPDIGILTETVASVRHHLPDAEIILAFDGVRPEQDHRRGDYEEHIRRALWTADKVWGNVCPFVFDQHLHQSGMMRKVLDEVRTPLLLFMEQDTPLVTDWAIDWQECQDVILSGEANSVRFHHESLIPEPHQHLMHDFIGGYVHETRDFGGQVVKQSTSGVRFLRTAQYSARPHLASTEYYRRIMRDHFTNKSNCFIEDPLHSVCQEAVKLRGRDGLLDHGLTIYHPDGSIKRSYHTDGRAGDQKFEAEQVF